MAFSDEELARIYDRFNAGNMSDEELAGLYDRYQAELSPQQQEPEALSLGSNFASGIKDYIPNTIQFGKDVINGVRHPIDTYNELKANPEGLRRTVGNMSGGTAGAISGATIGAMTGPAAIVAVPVGAAVGGALGSLGWNSVDQLAGNQPVTSTTKDLNDLAYNTGQGVLGEVVPAVGKKAVGLTASYVKPTTDFIFGNKNKYAAKVVADRIGTDAVSEIANAIAPESELPITAAEAFDRPELQSLVKALAGSSPEAQAKLDLFEKNRNAARNEMVDNVGNGTRLTEDQAGALLKDKLSDIYEAQKAEVNKAYKSIGADDVVVNMDGLKPSIEDNAIELYARSTKGMPKDVTPFYKRLTGDIGLTFADLRRMDGELGELANDLSANGRKIDAMFAMQLKDSVLGAMDNAASSGMLSPEQVGLYENAKNLRRKQGELFEKGAGASILGDMSQAAVVQKILSNPENASQLAEILAGDVEGDKILRSGIRSHIFDNYTNANTGKLKPAQYAKLLTKSGNELGITLGDESLDSLNKVRRNIDQEIAIKEREKGPSDRGTNTAQNQYSIENIDRLVNILGDPNYMTGAGAALGYTSGSPGAGSILGGIVGNQVGKKLTAKANSIKGAAMDLLLDPEKLKASLPDLTPRERVSLVKALYPRLLPVFYNESDDGVD